MLVQLFPHRKRSVLELILRRCDLDLLRAIEQCHPPMKPNDGRHDNGVSSTSAQRTAADAGADEPSSADKAADKLEPIFASAFRPPTTSLQHAADAFGAYSTQQVGDVNISHFPFPQRASASLAEYAAHVNGVYWFQYTTHTQKQNKTNTQKTTLPTLAICFGLGAGQIDIRQPNVYFGSRQVCCD